MRSQASLKRLSKGVIRVGATSNPKARQASYSSQGYSGTMTVSKTQNMRSAENRMLKSNSYKHNKQRSSNMRGKPGYVYKIKGKKDEDVTAVSSDTYLHSTTVRTVSRCTITIIICAQFVKSCSQCL